MLGGGGGAASLAKSSRPCGDREGPAGKEGDGVADLFWERGIWPRGDGVVARGLVVPARAWGSSAAGGRDRGGGLSLGY
jgi:hypothetical protein